MYLVCETNNGVLEFVSGHKELADAQQVFNDIKARVGEDDIVVILQAADIYQPGLTV